MTEKRGLNGFGIFAAFVGGAAAGAAAALLLAPVSGEEARRRIKDMASTSRERVARVPKAIASAYSQASEVAKDAFSEAYQAATRR
jgi:gas vesicle protein